MSGATTAKTPPLRKVLAEVLLDPRIPHGMAIVAAETVVLDAEITMWFVDELKRSGTDEQVMDVLETKDTCIAEVSSVWTQYRSGDATRESLSRALDAARESLRRLLDTRKTPGKNAGEP